MMLMLKGKRCILIVSGIIVLIAILIIIYFVQQSRPQNVIENRLKIKLPSNSKIVNYTYHNDGGYFAAQILIESKNVNSVKEQLSNLCGGIYKQKYSDYNFENVYEWWDLDKQNIEVSYNIDLASERMWWFESSPKAHNMWAFISKDKEGRNYLYISY